MGARGDAVVEALRDKPEGRVIDSRWCHWNFSLTLSFRPHYGPGADSASDRNEYQEYFLGVKDPLYRRLGGPQGRSGQVRKISPPTGIRSPDRPARSQSLYRLSYPVHYRNEYQEYFLWGKGGRCVGLTSWHIHVPIVLKSGILELLERSRPVQGYIYLYQ
jgi:hypothetical protein